MLALIDRQTGDRLPGDRVGFTRSSLQTLEVRRDSEGIMSDPHHDRVMELGYRCGDLLINNYPIVVAQSITDRLADDIQPPERAEAFKLGARNAFQSAVEVSPYVPYVPDAATNAGANV
jgi:hypothetical protein